MDEHDALSPEMSPAIDLDVLELVLDEPASPLVPPGLGGLAALVTAVRLPAFPSDLRGEAVAREAFRVAVPTQLSRRSRRRRLVAVAATVTVTLGLGSGLAAAGSLPGPAQDLASSALDAIGVGVPDSHGHVPGEGSNPSAPGQDPSFDPGQSGDDHGHDPQGNGDPHSSDATGDPHSGDATGDPHSSDAQQGNNGNPDPHSNTNSGNSIGTPPTVPPGKPAK